MKPTPSLKIGLLGSGQLARMLSLRAHSMGLQPWVYGSLKTDPAAQVTADFVVGELSHKDSLFRFLNQVDVATFESEFLEGPLLNELSKQTRVPIWPHPLTMEKLQDRWTQKHLLKESGLPTSDFCRVDKAEDLLQAWPHFEKTGIVLKKRKFGYDGYGTFIIQSETSLKEMLPLIKNEKQGFIAEAFVPFKRELAVSAARNKNGDLIFLPLVESFQKESRCFWVKGPVSHPKLSSLKSKIKKFLDLHEYVGVMAFELFEYKENLLVNEIAPRVHNSAHYSLDALDVDQFQLHLMALLNLDLPTPKLLSPGFAMVNLLGSSRETPKWKDLPGVQMHWYGKKDNRPGRKMGHINALASSANKALNQALKALKEIQV